MARRLLALTSTWSRDDAVGTDLEGLLRALAEDGWDARAATDRADPAFAAWIAADAEERLADPACVLLYVHTFDWPAGLGRLERARGPRLMRYHGGPHPATFRPFDRAYAAAIARYRGVSPRTVAACDAFLPVSPFAARRLWRWGAATERVHVVPPFHRLETLAATTPDAALAARLAADARPCVLTVARLSAQKGQHRVPAVAAALRALGRPDVVFRLVGRVEHGGYAEALERAARAHGVEACVERHEPTDAAGLRAHLAAARALLVSSTSEGFCVPILEAQALGVPVVANRSDAVPETAGAGAVLVDMERPEEVAAALQQVLADAGTRARLVAAGHANVERFGRPLLSAALRAALAREAARAPARRPRSGVRAALRRLGRRLAAPPAALSGPAR